MKINHDNVLVTTTSSAGTSVATQARSLVVAPVTMQEIRVSLHEIHSEGMVLSEIFQGALVIEKFPLACKNFKSYLKHKQKKMSVEDLIVRVRIEEDNKGSKKRVLDPPMAKENIVEHDSSSKSKKNNSSRRSKMGPNGGISKKQKFQGKCFNCDKVGHKVTNCKLPKENHEANIVDNIANNAAELSFTTVMSEVNMVISKPKEWWIDTGSTRHVCSDKEMFTTFEPVQNRDMLFMGNSTTSIIEDQGKVGLKMDFGKELALNPGGQSLYQ